MKKTRIPILQMALIGLLPNVLKKAYYRSKGAKLGSNVTFGLFSYLDASQIRIDDNATIGPFTFIVCQKLHIGKRVTIGALTAIKCVELQIGNDAVIMEQVVIGGMLTPRSRIRIGERSKIFPYSFLNPTEPIEIGNEVGIGGGNYIFTHGSWQSILDGFPVTYGPVTIEDGVWLPWRVFVMPNVTIGAYATIGASSTVTKDIPPRSLAAGTPAKVIRDASSHAIPMPLEEQHAVICGILRELAEYLTFCGGHCQFETTAEGAQILVNGQIYGRANIVYTRILAVAKDSQAFTLFLEAPEGLRDEMIRQGQLQNWFDISAKESTYRDAMLWTEIKDYFGRYGIRFRIVD